MKGKDATGRTVAVINTAWAMLVGTAVIWWIRTDLYPHLIEDGSLEGDVAVLVGAFAIGVVMAAPSVFKTRAVDLIESWKEWRS